VEQAVQQLVVRPDKVERDQVGMLVHKVDWVVQATVDTMDTVDTMCTSTSIITITMATTVTTR
jgi:hypothetical protein